MTVTFSPLPHAKVSHSQMVLQPTYPYQIHWPKLHIMDETLYRIALPRSSA